MEGLRQVISTIAQAAISRQSSDTGLLCDGSKEEGQWSGHPPSRSMGVEHNGPINLEATGELTENSYMIDPPRSVRIGVHDPVHEARVVAFTNNRRVYGG